MLAYAPSAKNRLEIGLVRVVGFSRWPRDSTTKAAQSLQLHRPKTAGRPAFLNVEYTCVRCCIYRLVSLSRPSQAQYILRLD